MNIKRLKRYLVPAIVLVHILLIYLGGYFLSPEFTVYPDLISKGLKPYTGLIDQHLPIIFFGPFSLPKSLTQNPQPLLAVFLSLVAISDLLFFNLLKVKRVKNPILWTALFAIASFIFSGNTLWLETFITPLLLLLLVLKPSQIGQLAIGALTSLILLIRPTLAPAILLFGFYKKIKPSRFLLSGFLSPLLIVLAYLTFNQLSSSFLDLFFNFNTNYYSLYAGKLPNLRQIFLVAIIITPALVVTLKRKKILPILVLLFSLLPAWPRFELTHLQPALVVSIYFWAKAKDKKTSLFLPTLLLVFLSVLSIKKIATTNYGNFYLTSETIKISQQIKSQPTNQVFVLGGSDLIYSLSGKNPAGDYYLPSLPWYYQNKDFVDNQLKALRLNSQALVVVNNSSSVNGVSIKKFASPVYDYIIENYSLFHTEGQYQIYRIKQ